MASASCRVYHTHEKSRHVIFLYLIYTFNLAITQQKKINPEILKILPILPKFSKKKASDAYSSLARLPGRWVRPHIRDEGPWLGLGLRLLQVQVVGVEGGAGLQLDHRHAWGGWGQGEGRAGFIN